MGLPKCSGDFFSYQGILRILSLFEGWITAQLSPPITENPPSSGGARMTDFKKAALARNDPEPWCMGDGYLEILKDLDQKLFHGQGEPLPVDSYLKDENKGLCVVPILTNPKQKWVGREFLKWLAGQDGNPKDLSPFDVFYAYSSLYGDQFHEKWQPL